MRKRGTILAISLLSVLAMVACGRASDEAINEALGIEPTATLSGEQIAQATERADAAASAVAAGATPVPGESDVLALGDVRLGQQQFQFQCLSCHAASGAGAGPPLTGPESPILAMTDQELFDLVRTGEGHTGQPAVSTARISDRQLASIVAYVRDQLENPGT